jgi:hypothetical protein
VRRVAAASRTLPARAARYDWEAVGAALDDRGHARLPGLLSAAECRAAIRLYADRSRFRSFIDMARHRFGEGDYRYFAAPLPDLVQELRSGLYEPLARIANAWSERLGEEAVLPARLASTSGSAARPGRRGRPLSCCTTPRAATTACTRTSTARSCSRFR